MEFTISNSSNIGSLTGLNTLMDTVGMSKDWIPKKGLKIPGTNHHLANEIRQKFIYREKIPRAKK